VNSPDKLVKSRPQLLAQLKELELTARQLEPNPDQRHKMAEMITQYSTQYLQELPNKLTYDQPDVNKKGDFSIEEQPANLDEILTHIDQEVNHQGINPASGGHLGYIPGGGLVSAAWGDFLADISNRYSGVYFAAPGAVRMEHTLVRWLCDLIGYPERSGGTLTSGGSTATLTAVVNARDAQQVDVSNLPQYTIYLTAQIHHCVQKALHIAGLSTCTIRQVPMKEFRMDTKALQEMLATDQQLGLKPFMVMASAGTTEAGVVDPLDKIAEIAHQHGAWYHVDAAYGGFFLLTTYGKEKLTGIDQADSVVIDPHKGMFLPYGSGAVLVKDQNLLYNSMHYFANYMQDAVPEQHQQSPADLSIELSRHFRGMRMWLPLKLLGVKPFRAALEEKLWLARYFYQEISTWPNMELGPFPELSVSFFRYLPTKGNTDQFNEQLVQLIQKDGRVFFSSTTLDGIFYLRLAVLNFRTHLDEIDLALSILRQNIEHLNATA